MHIGNTFTNQFKGFGVVEKVQSLLVCQVRLFGKQLDDTRILALQKNGIGLHRLKRDGCNKMKTSVQHLLGSDTQLMVGLFPTQLVKCLFARVKTLQIKIHRVENLVVSDTALDDVILLMRKTFPTGSDVVEPLAIVGSEDLASDAWHPIRKVEYVHDGIFATTDKTLSIAPSLFFQRSEIEPNTKVQMLARMAHIGMRNNDIGCVINPHTAFRSPFLFIKSTRSSTMYSRENVCNTS